ncbi:tetratricopeptide repeat protein [Planktothrix mougeotii]|uniref:Tetratricopeptide repeat protein n=1 Tax=Planktothrix mougeotii LEGE 06226 TaxID=1828728 RepID=A0ABR9UBQ7_9CYAN|nr:tetratricopeptide repeat protein [Planktothrix mougeotii]MBE9143888.1 tetratricopeptide repeat protein [Planktothrix mougeotii LEGE 06226]
MINNHFVKTKKLSNHPFIVLSPDIKLNLEEQTIPVQTNHIDPSLRIEIERYQQEIVQDPNSDLAYYNLAVALQQQGLMDAAFENYQTAIQLNPQGINSYINLGLIWVQKENLKEAVATFKQGLIHSPQSAKLHHNLAHTYFKQGNIDAAIAGYLQAIQLQPDLKEAYLNIGKAFKKQGLHSVAIQYFKQLIQLEPESILAHSECAALLLEQGQLSEAMLNFKAIIELEKPWITAYCQSVEHLDGQDELDQARISCGKFIQALQHNPQSGKVYQYFAKINFHIGNSLAEYRNYPQAEYYYQKSIQAHQNWIDPYLKLAQCFIHQKDFVSAAIYYHKALGINPDQPEIYQQLTGVLEEQKLDCKQHNLSNLNIKFSANFHQSELTHANCQGLDCPICLNQVFKVLNPTRLAEGIYDCSQPQDLPWESLPQSITIIPDGKAWIAPQKSWWNVCNAIAILNSKNELLTDLSRFYPTPLPGCETIDWNQHQIFSLEEFPPLEKISGSVAVVSGLSGNVYFHWMVDILPRFAILLQEKPDYLQSIDWFLLNSIKAPFQRETLQKLGIPEAKIIESDRHPYIQAKQLIIPSFTGSVGWVTPEIINFHRQLFDVAITPSKNNYPERIFIRRNRAKYRQILNESDVIAYLSEWGVVPVELETLSVEEQARLFAHAKVIIAPHGAGLTNLMFCRPETLVIELVSPHYIRHYYWIISQQLRLKHYYITGEEFSCYPLQKLMYQSPLIEDIYVKINTLENILQILTPTFQNQTQIYSCFSPFKARGQPEEKDHFFLITPTIDLIDTGIISIDLRQTEQKIDQGSSKANMVTTSYNKNRTTFSEESSILEAKNSSNSLGSRLTSLDLFRLSKQENITVIEISLKTAHTYFEQKNYQQVVEECKRVIDLDPNAVDAYHLLGKALQGLGQPKEALKWYQNVVNLKPDEAIVYANIGNLYAQLKHWKQAIYSYQKAIKLQPDLALAYRNLGKVWSKIGKLKIAASCWYQAFSLEPNTIKPEEHLSLGNILFRQGKINQAESCYRYALKGNSNPVEVYHNLGELFATQEKWADAESFYQQAIQLNPKSFESYNSLGKVLVAQGKWEEVVSCYHQALELNPRLLLALQNLTQALLHHHKGVVENSDYRQVLLLMAGNLPTQPILASQMRSANIIPEASTPKRAVTELVSLQEAQEYYTQQEYESCLRLCQQLLQKSPQDIAVYKLLAKVLIKQEKLEKAKLCYQKAIALQPQNEELYLELGDVFAQHQQWQQAIACYQKALIIQPQAQTYHQLSHLWQTLGHSENAEDCLYEALQLTPEKATLEDYLKLGNALWKRGQMTQAMICYRQVLDRDPQQIVAHQRLAQGLQQQNQLEAAIAHYQQAYQVAIQQQTKTHKSSLNPDFLPYYETDWLAETQALLGDIYVQQEQWQDAIVCYQEAVKLNPQLVSIQEILGDIGFENQDWELAISCYRQVLELEPDAWQVYHKLGDTLREQGNLKEAVKAYRQATELAKKLVN